MSVADCDQSNYSLRIVFSHIPVEFGQKGIGAIRSADPENPTVEQNMKWIGWSLAEIWPFEIFPNVMLVGRRSVGRSSIYNSSYTDLIYSSSLRYERSTRGVKIKSACCPEIELYVLSR